MGESYYTRVAFRLGVRNSSCGALWQFNWSLQNRVIRVEDRGDHTLVTVKGNLPTPSRTILYRMPCRPWIRTGADTYKIKVKDTYEDFMRYKGYLLTFRSRG